MFKFVNVYINKNKKNYVLAMGLILFATLFSVLIPQVINVIIDFVFNYSDLSYEKQNFITKIFTSGLFGEIETLKLFVSLLIILFVFALLKALTKFGSSFYLNVIGMNISSYARGEGLSKLNRRLNNSSGETFIILTNDVNALRDTIILYIPTFIENALLILFGVSLTFTTNIYLGIGLVGISILMVIIEIVFYKTNGKAFEEVRLCEGRLNHFAKVNFEGIKDTKAFRNEERVLKEFDGENENYYSSKIKIMKRFHRYKILINLLRAIFYGGSILISGLLALRGEITIGGFVTITTYIVICLDSILKLIDTFYNFLEKKMGITRYKEFIKSGKLQDEIEVKELEKKNVDIFFNNISTKIGTKYMFKNIYFDIPYGTKFGIYCTQGEGKTTLFNLLLHILEQDSGEILFDDAEIGYYSNASIRKLFSFVSQEPFIFNDTVKGNIVFYEKYDKNKYNHLMKLLEINDYKISSLKEDEKITENGYEIPSQEKQLLSIARALYRNAPILLLDNIFNKFDLATSNKLLDKILDYYAGRTVIFASTRAEDFEKFDKIIVIKKGVIVEEGDYKHLIDLKGEFYKGLESKQFEKGESN